VDRVDHLFLRRAAAVLALAVVLAAGLIAGACWERFRSQSAAGADAAAMGAPEDRSRVPLPATDGGRQEGAAALAPEAVRLQAGRARAMTMDFRHQWQHQFVVEVPHDAVAMQVEVAAAPCIFDLFGRALAPIEDPAYDAEHYNQALENKLRVSRYSETPLETGDFYLSVEYPSLYPPVLGNRTLRAATYEITVSFVATRIDAELRPGAPAAGRLDPDSGSFRTYVIDVPEDAEALRIDLDNTHSDLDLLASHQAQILHPEEADHTSAGSVGREILVIDRDSDPPLAAGRWYVNVVESSALDEAEFTIYASLSADPPEPLLAIPAPPPTPDGKWRALYATVDLTTGAYSGSGVLLTEEGLILTNHHVVAEAVVAAEARRKELAASAKADGAAAAPALDDVIVAITIDPRHPPVEMFRGEVVEYDEKEDLALVQVTRGYYGQPLPRAYGFPHVELGNPNELEIGDPLYVVGFPAVGDLRNRPAVTLTRGIVSGFSGAKNIKSDALISGGNSGGGAFDQNWRLIGCPTYTVSGYDGDFGQLGYIVSLNAMPQAWRKRIK
jgi:S1-C subfamily serine protease